MGKLESTIKSEIQRLAKREVRSVSLPIKRDVRKMKITLSKLSKTFSGLERFAKEALKEAKPKLEATPEEVKSSRITPDRIRGLRKKLGISQRELGVLTGATIGAVASWERGKFKARGEKKVALVALRKIRKRDVKKMLAEKSEPASKEKFFKSEVKPKRKKPVKREMKSKKAMKNRK